MPNRLERLRAKMEALALPALLVTKREHLYYLAGFTGSTGVLIITAGKQLFLTDFRYVLQVGQEAPDWELVKVERSQAETVRETLSGLGVSSVGFEPDDLTVSLYEAYGGKDAALPYTLTPAPNPVEELRLVKDAEEIDAIRAATRITDDAYAHLLTHVKPGVTESELALEAEWYMRRHGAESAFDIIVAAGPRGALPHAQPGERPLAVGDMVVVDMGARYRHYCSDMTRTFAVGSADDTARTIYHLCLQAQLAGVHGTRAGLTGREADAIVRDVITAEGYGDCFGHGTGHGVGLEVHEAPRLSRTGDAPLPAGCVVTIEPGIYLPEVAGVRIEDLCLVTETGVEILTGTPKPAELPIYG
ncbi:MAG: M24 family metallopeptidase [Armatimonadota bacterium]